MFNLKIVVLIFGAAINLVLSNEMDLAKLHESCVASTGVNEEFIVEANKGNFVEDEKLKSYMHCVFKTIGVVGDDGIMDQEALIAKHHEGMREEAKVVVKACGTKVGISPSDNVWLTQKCFYETNPSIYILP